MNTRSEYSTVLRQLVRSYRAAYMHEGANSQSERTCVDFAARCLRLRHQHPELLMSIAAVAGRVGHLMQQLQVTAPEAAPIRPLLSGRALGA